jgi:hypothetical protein
MNETFKKMIYIVAGIIAITLIVILLTGFTDPLQESIFERIRFIMRLFTHGD